MFYFVCLQRSHFNKLGAVIAAHSRIKEKSKFLFIPGPEDLGIATLYSLHVHFLLIPRAPIFGLLIFDRTC